MLPDAAQLSSFLSSIQLFSKLDEEQIALIVEAVHPVLYPAGQTVYSAGEEAADLFIIYRGRVRIRHELGEGEPDYTAVLYPADYFGQEVLAGENYRQADATAEDDSILLLLDGDYLRSLGHDIPPLRTRLDLASRSFRLLWALPSRWREQDEHIYYLARRTRYLLYLRMIGPALLTLVSIPIFLTDELITGRLLTPLILAGVIFMAGVAWGIWTYIDWSNDYFIITDRRIVYLERIVLLYDSRTEAPMDAILSVNKSTSQLGRILGYGTITVRSFTGTIVMDRIDQPQEVQVIIEKMITRAKGQQAEEQLRAIDRTISNRLGGQPIQPQQPAPGPEPDTASEAPSQPAAFQLSGLQRWLINFLHLRMEENGIITYRKHWFVLLQQVWWPTVALIFLLAILVMRILKVFTFMSFGSTVLTLFMISLVFDVWWIYQYVDWTNDIYVITHDQIVDIDKRPLGSEKRNAAPIKNILSIEYERLGFIGFILNFGTVYIKVGESTFTFDYVFNPSEVQRELFNRFSEVKYKEKQAQEAEEQRRMADWIEGYHRWREQQGPGVPPPASGPFPR